MDEKFSEFYNKYNGIPNVGDTPENQGQCVGLFSVWIDFLGLPYHEWGNAKDLLTNADPAYLEVIFNTPDNIPQIGDCIVWGTQVGPDGHVAIFKEGDVNTFTSFDENWPVGSAPHLQTHNYSGVLGWLRPKLTIPSPQSTITSMPDYLTGLFKEQNLDPENEPAVRAFWQQAIDFPSCNTDKINAQTALATANNQISEFQGQVTNLKTANDQQAAMIESLQKDLQNAQQTPNFTPKTGLGKFFLSLSRSLG